MNSINEGFFRIIESKDMSSDKTSIDFHSTYTKLRHRDDIPVIGFVEVTEDIVQRLDIIVSNYYGNPELLDLFLKFNKIDDMFSVPIGSKLMVPDMFSLLEAYECCSTEPKHKLRIDSNKTKRFVGGNKSQQQNQDRTTKQTRGTGWKVVKKGVIKF